MEEKQKVNYSTFVQAASSVVTAVALILLMFGWLAPDEQQGTNQPEARGTTNFSEIDVDDGSASDPGFGFSDDTDTGLYRVGANNVGIAVGGAIAVDVDSTGLDLNSKQLSNVGAAGTDFGSDGSLTLAGALAANGGITVDTTAFIVADTTGNTTIAGTLNQQGNVSDSGGAFTVADNTLFDGAADAIQITVQGFTTQTSSLQVWEQSDGTDVGTMSNAGALDIESTLNAAGLATFQAGLTSSDGDNVVADDLRITAQTSITVTNGNPFTATGSYQPIVAAAEVTPTLTAGTAGDLLVLINTGTNVINVADTGTQMLTAAAALGQYDSLTLWSDGTNWIEISRADN